MQMHKKVQYLFFYFKGGLIAQKIKSQFKKRNAHILMDKIFYHEHSKCWGRQLNIQYNQIHIQYRVWAQESHVQYTFQGKSITNFTFKNNSTSNFIDGFLYGSLISYELFLTDTAKYFNQNFTQNNIFYNMIEHVRNNKIEEKYNETYDHIEDPLGDVMPQEWNNFLSFLDQKIQDQVISNQEAQTYITQIDNSTISIDSVYNYIEGIET